MSTVQPHPRPDSKATDAIIAGDKTENPNAQVKDESPPTEHTVPPSIPPCNLQTSHADDSKNEPSEWKKNSVERALFIIEFLGLAGLVWYCLLTNGELKVFESERKTMENEFRLSQTNFSAQMVEMRRESDLLKRQIDDVEAQQRAFLTVERVDIHRLTNSTGSAGNPKRYSVHFQMVVRNIGSTAAIDLRGTGALFPENLERIYMERGATNLIPNFRGIKPIPDPGEGGPVVAPQSLFTNEYDTGDWDVGYGFRIVTWVSYRDVFGRAGVIGEGGTYNFTNDTFTPEFINWDKFPSLSNTNDHPK